MTRSSDRIEDNDSELGSGPGSADDGIASPHGNFADAGDPPTAEHASRSPADPNQSDAPLAATPPGVSKPALPRAFALAVEENPDSEETPDLQGTGSIRQAPGQFVTDALVAGVFNPGKTQADAPNFTPSAGDTWQETERGEVVAVVAANTPPVAAPDFADLLEGRDGAGPSVVAGNVLLNDSDAESPTLVVTTAGTLAGQYGALTLDSDGSYVYLLNDADPGVNALNGGATLVDTFAYSVADGGSPAATTAATLTISIHGVNDSPIAIPDWASVAELADSAAVSTVTGNVLDNDFDPDTAHAALTADAGVFSGLYGTLTLGIDGSYVYALDNTDTAVNALNAGQTLTDSFTYMMSDNGSPALGSSATLAIAINGANDSPTALPDWASVAELADSAAVATVTGNVLDNDFDPDTAHAALTADAGVFNGLYGTLTLGIDGSYVYALDNTDTAVNALNVGQTLTDSFTYMMRDNGSPALGSSATLAIAINGANDSPTAAADNNSVSEAAYTLAPTVVTGNVLSNDTDPDTAPSSFTATAGTFAGSYGMLTLGADGTYSYALDNANVAVNSLDAGQTLTDTFVYAMNDNGSPNRSAGATLAISIDGVDDKPTLSIGDVTVNEGAGTATFTITLTGQLGSSLTFQAVTADSTARSIAAGIGTPDFTATTQDVTFMPLAVASQTRIATINLNNDTVHENVETFSVNLAGASSSQVDVAASDLNAVATINDNDPAPTLSINSPAAVNEGTRITFTLSLSAGSAVPITLDLAALGVTATGGPTPFANTTDFENNGFEYRVGSSGSFLTAGGPNQTEITFNPGQTTIQIRIETNNDTFDEPASETFQLGVGSVLSGSIANPGVTGTGTINDNDAAPAITVANAAAVAEGAPLVFTITLNRPSAAPITLRLGTTDNGATAGSDFEASGFEVNTGSGWVPAASGTDVTFAPGATSLQVRVDSYDDYIDENNEGMRLVVQSVLTGNATIADGIGDGTIQDNDSTGNNNANTLTGTVGANMLDGRGGNDTLNGLGGDDLLIGGAGNDVLVGGAGADQMTGGTGTDVFRYAASDNIAAFDDVITDFALDSAATPGNQGDVFDVLGVVGAGAFNAGSGTVSNYVRVADAGGSPAVQVDADGAAGGASFETIAVLSSVAYSPGLQVTAISDGNFTISI